MSRVYKRTDASVQWWCDYVANGRRIREEGGATKRAAEQVLARRLEEVRLGEWRPKAERGMPIGDLAVAELADLWTQHARRKQKASVVDDERRLAVIVRLLGPSTPVASIQCSQIEHLWDRLARRRVAGRPISTATVNRYRAVLRSALRLAVDVRGLNHGIPARLVSTPQEPFRNRVATRLELWVDIIPFTLLSAIRSDGEDRRRGVERRPPHRLPVAVRWLLGADNPCSILGASDPHDGIQCTTGGAYGGGLHRTGRHGPTVLA